MKYPGAVFAFTDVTMGLLAVVNLIGLVWMYIIGLRLLRDYNQQRKTGVNPKLRVEDYGALDIDESAWPG